MHLIPLLISIAEVSYPIYYRAQGKGWPKTGRQFFCGQLKHGGLQGHAPKLYKGNIEVYAYNATYRCREAYSCINAVCH